MRELGERAVLCHTQAYNQFSAGRNGEGGAEDPYLMGELATAWTRGLQNSSDDPARVQVAVTLKHFVANSIESTIGWSAQVRKTHLLRNSILNTIIYQDRLGTTTPKTQKERHFLAGGGRLLDATQYQRQHQQLYLERRVLPRLSQCHQES